MSALKYTKVGEMSADNTEEQMQAVSLAGNVFITTSHSFDSFGYFNQSLIIY